MQNLTAGGHRLEFAWIGAPQPQRKPEQDLRKIVPARHVDNDSTPVRPGDITPQGQFCVSPAEGNAPVLVFLHEGLGSLALWRDFPARIASATGCRALVYSRYGYGKSAHLTRPRQVDYMHDEALHTLPDLLRQLEIRRPILIGHSDGASIALIHAAAAPCPVRALILLAPHVLVEDLSIAGIARVKIAWQKTDLPGRLARYHDDAESTFRGWNDIWLHPDFRDWNIEKFLPQITCPVLAIQGEQDEYGSMEQIDRIAREVADVELIKLADCRHSPQHDQPDHVIDATVRFIARV